MRLVFLFRWLLCSAGLVSLSDGGMLPITSYHGGGSIRRFVSRSLVAAWCTLCGAKLYLPILGDVSLSYAVVRVFELDRSGC